MQLLKGKGKIIFLRKKVLVFGALVFIVAGLLTWQAQERSVPKFSEDGLWQKLRRGIVWSNEDWFEKNLTKFEEWKRQANLNFTVMRQTTIKTEGDFSCSTSEILGFCAFKVDSVIQAVSQCNKYHRVCVGFVLRKNMMVHLKYKIVKPLFSNEAATFIRYSYLKNL